MEHASLPLSPSSLLRLPLLVRLQYLLYLHRMFSAPPCRNPSLPFLFPPVEEVQQYLAGMKARFLELRQYVEHGRQEATTNILRLQDELRGLEVFVTSVNPDTAPVIQSISTAKQQELNNLEQTMQSHEARVPREKAYMVSMLPECYKEVPVVPTGGQIFRLYCQQQGH